MEEVRLQSWQWFPPCEADHGPTVQTTQQLCDVAPAPAIAGAG